MIKYSHLNWQLKMKPASIVKITYYTNSDVRLSRIIGNYVDTVIIEVEENGEWKQLLIEDALRSDKVPNKIKKKLLFTMDTSSLIDIK